MIEDLWIVVGVWLVLNAFMAAVLGIAALTQRAVVGRGRAGRATPVVVGEPETTD